MTHGPVHVLKGVCEGHHGVAHELQLVLESCVLPSKSVVGRARLGVLVVVGRSGAVGVSTLKMVFPELCEHISQVVIYNDI